MVNIIFPHFTPVRWGDVLFDRCGIGAVNRSFNEAAIWVSMRPSVFLDIATPLLAPRSSLLWITTEIESGSPIAPAELRVRICHAMPAVAMSHEGRHRMTALRNLANDNLMPVRISLQGIGDEEVDDQMLNLLRRGMKAQRGRAEVSGPLFEEAELDLGSFFVTGIPPPVTAVSQPCASYILPKTRAACP